MYEITLLPSSNENGHLLRLFMVEATTRVFELKRQELTECWRKICNEGIRNCYCLINMIKMKNSMEMVCERHVELTG